MQRKALFLDRDGVINVDHGYVYRPEDFHFVEGIFEVVRAARAAGYLVVVVTNQAGIGRGFYTEADFQTLMTWVIEIFAAQQAPLDAVYHSPYHAELGIGKYKQDSDCRKPKPGMLFRAAKDLDLDLSASCLIGDRLTDIEAARAAGLTKAWLIGRHPDMDWPKVQEIARLSEVIPYFRHTAAPAMPH